MTSDEWNKLADQISKTNNIVTLDTLTKYIKKSSGYNLTLKEKEFIYEVYKSVYDDAGNKIDGDQPRSNTIER